MFGISFAELVVIATMALVVVGPQKLPGMLRTLGHWMRKLRKLTTEVRAQTGIDQILREEGIDGVQELRSLLRGEIRAARQHHIQPDDPYPAAVDFDSGREYPSEGVDAYHAIPDDLLDNDVTSANSAIARELPGAPLLPSDGSRAGHDPSHSEPAEPHLAKSPEPAPQTQSLTGKPS